MIEQDVQNTIRLEASKQGCRLFRNNVGGLYNKRGDFVRYGLGNDSAAVNKVLKSSDLIGITPVRIGIEHVGRVLGVFTSIEVKHTDWVYRLTPHELAQLAWINLIKDNGGFAGFAANIGDFQCVIG